MYYIMTGDSFDGKKAAEYASLVNFAVPRAKLREETIKLAKKLIEKNAHALRAARRSTSFVEPWTIRKLKTTWRQRSLR